MTIQITLHGAELSFISTHQFSQSKTPLDRDIQLLRRSFSKADIYFKQLEHAFIVPIGEFSDVNHLKYFLEDTAGLLEYNPLSPSFERIVMNTYEFMPSSLSHDVDGWQVHTSLNQDDEVLSLLNHGRDIIAELNLPANQ